MKSSGIKRGMAALAIAAVAVTGIPALSTTAFADNLNQQAEENGGLDDVDLMNESNIELSTKPDGTDSTARLEAAAGRDVTTVRFEYSINGGATWITIADTTRNDDGAFSHEWANPPVGFVLQLRVRDVTPLGAGDTSTRTNIEIFGADPNTETINLKSETDKGYYEACAGAGTTVIVSGTRSETVAGVARTPLIGGVGVDDNTTWEDGPFDADIHPALSFSGFIDISNEYDFADTPGELPDQLAVRARTDSAVNPNETEDFEAYTLYEQAITKVTAVDATNGNGSLPTEVVVTVTDQKGAPIAGAEVHQVGTFAILPVPVILDTLETNSKGEALFSQSLSTGNYFADANCNSEYRGSEGDVNSGPFQAGGTVSSLTIASTPEGRRPVGSSTTETVTVLDNTGKPIVGRQVRFTRTGPDGSSEVVYRTSDAAGKATYVATCTTAGTISIQAAIQDPSGTGTPLPSDPFNRFANDKIGCGNDAVNKKKINPAIKGKNVNGGDDWVLVRAKAAAGADVKIYKITGKNVRKLVDTGKLNGNGVFKNVYNDTNGADLTTYKAVVSATATTQRGVTNRLQQPKIK